MDKKIVFLSLVFSLVTSIVLAETLEIKEVPIKLPRNLPLNSYSPLLEIEYSGLKQNNYTLKLWLLNRGPWYCASSIICEESIPIDNSAGNKESGKLRLVKPIDVYNYANMDFVARLYSNSGVHVAWDEQYVNGVSNRPPKLDLIPTQTSVVGQTLEFVATATDQEVDSLTYRASALPEGAVLNPNGSFNWTPDAEGIYEIYVSVDDGSTYDSQKVTINVGPTPEFSEVDIPRCGTNKNVTGRINNLDAAENYRLVSYIFISGSGWWVKPYKDKPKTIIQSDGSFELDITTGGIDELATIIYLAIVHRDALVPMLSGEPSIPDGLPVLTERKYYRSPTDCHRIIEFSGYRWYVKKSGSGKLGPGPCYFSDAIQNVAVDEDGYLHLQIIRNGSRWICAEIVSVDEMGYGTYTIELSSDPTMLDKNAVLGLFTWADDAENGKEMDIEYSRWGNAQNSIGQFVVQPWDSPGHIDRFEFPSTNSSSTHRFKWQSAQVFFRASINGDQSFSQRKTVSDWTYRDDPPLPGRVHARINLWLYDNRPPSNGLTQSAIVKSFQFNAYDGSSHLPAVIELLLE